MSETLLPSSATKQERAIDLTTARLGDVAVPLRTLWDADTCAAALLPWLAWALSLDAWDDTWTEAEKRQSIKDAVDYHRKRGTVGSVRKSLLPWNADVVEWFEDTPVGDPYTFVVNMDDPSASEDVYTNVVRVVNKSKNARSHFAFRAQVDGQIVPAAVCVCGDVVTIG